MEKKKANSLYVFRHKFQSVNHVSISISIGQPHTRERTAECLHCNSKCSDRAWEYLVKLMVNKREEPLKLSLSALPYHSILLLLLLLLLPTRSFAYRAGISVSLALLLFSVKLVIKLKIAS